MYICIYTHIYIYIYIGSGFVGEDTVTLKFQSTCQEYRHLGRDIEEGWGGVEEEGDALFGEGVSPLTLGGGGGGGRGKEKRVGQVALLADALNGYLPDVVVDLSGLRFRV
jgi:hypothetical protein